MSIYILVFCIGVVFGYATKYQKDRYTMPQNSKTVTAPKSSIVKKQRDTKSTIDTPRVVSPLKRDSLSLGDFE
jgi:hypothetical protein